MKQQYKVSNYTFPESDVLSKIIMGDAITEEDLEGVINITKEDPFRSDVYLPDSVRTIPRSFGNAKIKRFPKDLHNYLSFNAQNESFSNLFFDWRDYTDCAYCRLYYIDIDGDYVVTGQYDAEKTNLFSGSIPSSITFPENIVKLPRDFLDVSNNDFITLLDFSNTRITHWCTEVDILFVASGIILPNSLEVIEGEYLFSSSPFAPKYYFPGTISEWNNIIKIGNYASEGTIIHCSDGDVEVSYD